MRYIKYLAKNQKKKSRKTLTSSSFIKRGYNKR